LTLSSSRTTKVCAWRAGAVIDRLRTLLKKGTSVRQPVNLNEMAREVLDLTRSDLQARRIVATAKLAPSLPSVLGDRVQPFIQPRTILAHDNPPLTSIAAWSL
jgi:C4-dicarboxylate-specific signal transduction histidine kinase